MKLDWPRDMTMCTKGKHFIMTFEVHVMLLPFRLSGRVKKRAMSSFEKDKLMSSLSAQLDYNVSFSTVSS